MKRISIKKASNRFHSYNFIKKLALLTKPLVIITQYTVIVSLFILCISPDLTDASVVENDITLVMMTDIHYGYTNMVTVNQATIDNLNSFPGIDYPSSLGGGTVDQFRGVCILGDLTENGRQNQWDLFLNDFGVNGERRIKYPVYEGFGNHDGGANGLVANDIKSRNTQRKNLSKISDNGLHYSWNWDNVHFIQLNKYASSNEKQAGNSIAFLEQDLSENVGSTGMPVIIMQHYGWDDFSLDWWSDTERDALYTIIKNYNIIAYFHGHWHSQAHMTWKGIDIYRAGSTKGWNESGGCNLVVNIKKDTLRILGAAPNGWRGNRYIWEKTFDLGNIAIVNKLNPKTNMFKIIGNHLVKFNSNKPIKFSLFNVSGKILLRKTISKKSILDMGNYVPAGIYILSIKGYNNSMINRRLTIIK